MPLTRHCFLSVVAALLAAPVGATTTHGHKSSYTIAGVYPTKSQAARTASLVDLDQDEMVRLLDRSLHNQDGDWLQQANIVYQTGRHAGPYAKLHLDTPLDGRSIELPDPVDREYHNSIAPDGRGSHEVYELAVVGGTKHLDRTIRGISRTSDPRMTYRKGMDELVVLYPEGSTCLLDEREDDCYAAQGGVVLQGYGAIDYTHDPHADTHFLSSLRGFSEEEGLRMYYCEHHHNGCGRYTEYQHFYKYYGVLDYGDYWIEAAFAKRNTEYGGTRLANGNVDFSEVSDRTRNTAIATGTVALNVFTTINRELVEFALDGCAKNAKDFSTYGDSSAMDSVLAAWDTALAIYAGSALVVGDEDSTTKEPTLESSGSLYYNMVEELAHDFGVLEATPDGLGHRSMVNRQILQYFVDGKQGLLQGDCNGMARASYENILRGMRVPWIQGVLKAAYLLQHASSRGEHHHDEIRGKGVAFAAALLPDLHRCSRNAAEIVHRELSPDKVQPDFELVREVLEHEYECLGVTCDEIGGLVDPTTGLYHEEGPCGGYGKLLDQRRETVTYTQARAVQTPSSGSKAGFALSSFLVALVACCASLAVLVAVVHDRAQGRPVDVAASARRVVAGALSRADYYLSREASPSVSGGSLSLGGYRGLGHSHEPHNDYDVQLRSMPLESQAPLQQFA